MLSFWYNELKPRFGDKIKLVLSDTDSFIFEVLTDDVYRDLYNMRHLHDLSEYSVNSPYFDSSNVKVPGMFKDEKPGEVISEIVALKPKMYSILTYAFYNNHDKIVKDDWWLHYEKDDRWNDCWSPSLFRSNSSQTAKGVKMAAKKNINHEEYLKCLKEKSTKSVVQRTIRASEFQLLSLKMTKRALSAYDDKKYLLPDGLNTLAYGHYRIKD
jgi:hypothetical protein